MVVTLAQEKTIVIEAEKTAKTTTLTIKRMVDLPEEKIVRVFIAELPHPVILWEGAAYDAIGQWTDAMVSARLLVLYA